MAKHQDLKVLYLLTDSEDESTPFVFNSEEEVLGYVESNPHLDGAGLQRVVWKPNKRVKISKVEIVPM